MPAWRRGTRPAALCHAPAAPNGSKTGGVDERLGALFQALRGRRGLDLARFPIGEAVTFVRTRGKRMLPDIDSGSWRVNTSHDLISMVLSAPIAPEAQAEYLASLIYSCA